MKRRAFIASVVSVLGVSLAAEAQQRATVARIGVLGALTTSSSAPRIEAFKQGLRELGYVEGQNLVIEYRSAEGRYERLPGLATELAHLKVDAIVTHTTPGIRAAQQATTTIPIVMANSGDAVATGLVASLARPGGNITGSSHLSPEISAKRLELLKEAIPRLRRVAALMNHTNPLSEVDFKHIELTARSVGMEVRPAWVRPGGELESVFLALVKARTDALVIQEDAAFLAQARRIADLAARHRLPTAASLDHQHTGNFLSYGANLSDLWRRAAIFVDKILKGAKPADLPVEQPTKFELVINLKTAKSLGLTIPPAVLARADEVVQ